MYLVALLCRLRLKGKLLVSLAIPPVSVSHSCPLVLASTARVPVEWKRLVSE